MRRFAAYCAREAGHGETGEWAGARQWQFAGCRACGPGALAASDQLVALYRQWLTEGGELTLSLNPAGHRYAGCLFAADENRRGGREPGRFATMVPGVPDVYLGRG